MSPNHNFLRSILYGLLALSQLVTAHTWIEQLMVLDPNGTMVGQPGFPRGNLLRSNPAFNDPAMVNLIPPGGRPVNQIEKTDLMCKSSQTSQTQTGGSPRLQAAPGAGIALRYQENGHVSLPQNQPGKPPNRGTVYVYGTTQPSPDDSFLAIHRVWNAAGTGGDGRGVLLSTQNFDDGQCYQVNGGAISAQRQKAFPHTFNSVMGSDLWCQQDIALPANAPTGKPYTLYWVWDWPTMPGTAGFPEGKQEIYTTCMDVDIVSSGSAQPISKAAVHFAQGQDLNFAGIASEVADITNPTAVVGEFIPFGASATGPAIGQAATESASAIASPNVGSTIPAFLSVHTTSTGGPGLQTSIVTVIPIGQASITTVPIDFTPAAAAVPVPTQTDNGNNNGNGENQGLHSHGGGGSFGATGLTESALTAVTNIPAGGVHTQIPAAPAATATAIVNGGGGHGGQRIQTFTEFDSVTMTEFQTIYRTRFTKRAEDIMTTAAATVPTKVPVAPTREGSVCSKTAGVYRLRARLPFVWPARFIADTFGDDSSSSGSSGSC